jgi:nitrogenase-associated protein
MKSLIFYEKPGCKGNARQQAMLIEEGFDFEIKSILDEPWTKETLRPFFENKPVKEWFNTTAPAVKNELVKPESCSEEQALELMLNDPILIRRPLIEYKDSKTSGFDDHVINNVLEIGSKNDDMEDCQSVAQSEKCD